MLIYLDNCCFNRPFDAQRQIRVELETEAKLGIQEEVREGVLNLAWSYILDFENDSNPSVARKESIRRWSKYAFVDANETSEILEKARELVAIGLKKKDSLHLACALSMKCDIFFTTDDGILKKRSAIASIRILNPIEYYAIDNH
jgi:hypothetical protein